jgi:photosystem II stability/assembly factor-like uncharacterized protein
MPVDRKLASDAINSMKWRSIGHHRGGRVVAVAGHPTEDMIFYFGACAGGIWKTDDGGTYWQNISDGFLKTASVGAIAVSESDPNVIYAGMGESCIRNNVSYGDGVYRSTDGGKTWANVGLVETRHIARVRVNPRDSNLVYVAALGHTFGPNKERGIFRSKDGGDNWEQVLFVNETTGAADLIIDRNNPLILFATFWQVQRTPWGLNGGGPESGIYRSIDGGDTWENLNNKPGLPQVDKGRMGVTVSPARPGRVWTTIEAEHPGVFRSDDNGDNWEQVSDSHDVQARPWYYQHIFADPKDENTIWILNSSVWKSTDGGKAYEQVNTPHGDNHDLWIDPNNPKRMVEGNDGGATVTFNGGDTWSTIYNQSTAQIYHLDTDNQYPYRVYGTQQDNSAISVPSKTTKGAIPWGDCYTVGSSESGYIAVHPKDPNIVFSGAIGSSPGGGGNLLRYDHSTGQVRIVTVWPEFYTGWGAKDMKYRFQWTYPIKFSPHDSNVLYVAGNVLFKSTDQGDSWEALSPDLTRHDPATLEPSGGPITKDTSGAENYATIFAFAESPVDKGVFWAGSDDGLVHISRNDGKTWEDITPKELGEWALITMIEPSHYDGAKAYMTATRYKMDDPRPLLFRTTDYGASWTAINEGIREGDYLRCVREDPEKPGLLYAGSETGIYVSFNDGGKWQSLNANLPVVPVYDLAIKSDDLVAATHGRSFWILDDVTILRQMSEDIQDSAFRLLQPRDTYRPAATFGARRGSSGKNYMLALGAAVAYYEHKDELGSVQQTFLDAGQNPPAGAVITYLLKDSPSKELTLRISDSNGNVIKAFSSIKSDDSIHLQPEDPLASAQKGGNRFVWDMRYPFARKVPDDKALDPVTTGPLAPPGTYSVTLTVDGNSDTRTFQLIKDPRVATSQEDFEEQFKLAITVRDKFSQVTDAILDMRSIRDQATEWAKRADGTAIAEVVGNAANKLNGKLSEIEDQLMQTGYKGERDRLHIQAKLNRKLAELMNVISAADFRPTRQIYDVLSDINDRIDPNLVTLKDIKDKDLQDFINLLHEVEIPAIVPSSDFD